MPPTGQNAPGFPGIEPRWTSSAKDGIGTAYSSSACLWFTLSHGIVNEVYYPHVDTPNTRDLQFLITDGETFCHEEKRDLDHLIERPESGALLYRLTNSERQGRYRLITEVIGDPHSPVLLLHTWLEVPDRRLRGRLRVFALLAPHLKGTGQNNSARWGDVGGRPVFCGEREDVHLVFGCAPGFTRRSVGYVGRSDGWQDLMDNFQMDWEYGRADDGNIALTGEIDLSAEGEFTLALAFGGTPQSAATQFLQALAAPFAEQRQRFLDQWERARTQPAANGAALPASLPVRLSQRVLLAHEDKLFPGAFVASLSIPWGETKDDRDRGGYHLVWTRDMVQTATALLACGRTESPLRALILLAAVQRPDGSLPQNSWIDGKAYWHGVQLDEVGVPILLAWRLQRAKALRDFDPWTLVARAASYLVLQGPVTLQERWEENSGYSPSTLATVIAGLACAADFARERWDPAARDFLLAYADWLSSHLEEWMVTDRGELLPGQPRHYVRITPADPESADGTADPNSAILAVANGGGSHPARNVVGGDFLQLVRLGVRSAHDPAVLTSLAVIDHVLKCNLPQGPGWRRYNHDGYGQKEDGGAFDGTGIGRAWPLLTGERGHYELAAGRDPADLAATMAKFANDGGMLPEQVWDTDDLPEGRMRRGQAAGSAMPLCWAHAEYLSLIRSHRDGVCFDRVDPAYRRYVTQGVRGSPLEIWTFRHPIRRMSAGQRLRVILPTGATGGRMSGGRRPAKRKQRILARSTSGSPISRPSQARPRSNSPFSGRTPNPGRAGTIRSPSNPPRARGYQKRPDRRPAVPDRAFGSSGSKTIDRSVKIGVQGYMNKIATNEPAKFGYDIGMIGLGVMGRNFLLNMADHGFSVAGFDQDPAKIEALRVEGAGRPVRGAGAVGEFLGLLRRPRAIILLVPAGPPVDAVIAELVPHLRAGDLIIDAGNTHFTDTDRRAQDLAGKGLPYLGVGVSGGEEGARHGPSLMPGGPRGAYERVRPVFEASAAQVKGEPCVAYLGPGSAGHYVKMVHNGIEYGLMQLIAETYDLMKRGLGLSDDELHEFYAGWNEGELAGYLVEITGQIFSKEDEKTGQRLVDEIRGAAKQLGTGMWTSQSAMDLGIPAPTIDAAVAMRNLSTREEERAAASRALARPVRPCEGGRETLLPQLGGALLAATIVTYAQGFAVLRAASEKYHYGLDLGAVARIWRGGCIIRSALLEDIREAYRRDAELSHLFLASGLGLKLQAHEEDLRAAVTAAAAAGIPASALMSALGYLDGYRSAWLPANLIQAQRDYFGAHTYERLDVKGTFHTQWQAK